VNQQRQSTPSDDELLVRARAGDHGAFRIIVERYQSEVSRTVVGMLGSSQQVDDVAQEVFIQLFRSLDRFRGESSVSTYLKRIAINRSLDALRQRKRLTSRFLSRDGDETLPEPVADDDSPIERRERNEAVHRAIQALPEKHRAVAVLRLIDECSTEETAKILDLPYGTVLSRLSRAQKKLQTLLAPHMGIAVGNDQREEDAR
jgi:RNA polymerase sigma-70 factor (ECF subfamily)